MHINYTESYDPEILKYIEQFITEERKLSLKNTLETRTKFLVLCAEELIDKHNINAIIRTSECFGLQEFYNVTNKGNLKTSRSVTRGCDKWVNINEFDTTKDLFCELRRQKYKIYAADSNVIKSYTPQNIPIDNKIALIMGKEKEGISNYVRENCDGYVKVPIYGFTESYNVSVAAGLLSYTIIERMRSIGVEGLTDIEKRDLYYNWVWKSLNKPKNIYNQYLINKKI